MENVYMTEEYKGFNINIYYDNDVESPREWDNTAVFVCEHRRYTLGDEHDVEKAASELLRKYVSDQQIINYFVETHNAVLKVNKGLDPKAKGGNNAYPYYYEWGKDGNKDGMLCNPNDADDIAATADILVNQYLNVSEMLNLVAKTGKVIWRTISIYNHSGCDIFYGTAHGWDCGVLGFAYVEQSKAEKEKCAYETWQDYANARLDIEMQIYSEYVSGNCFGYEVTDENGNSTEFGCGGFIGTEEIDRMITEAKGEIDWYLERKEKGRKENIETIITNAASIIGEQFVGDDKVVRIVADTFGLPEMQAASITSSRVGDFKSVKFADLPDELISDIAKATKVV